MTPRPSPAPPYVGLRLYRERTRRGWSLYQAGDASGVAHTTVSLAEQGRDIRMSTLLALAGAYGVSLDALTAEPGCGKCLDWGECPECGRGGVNGNTISDDGRTTAMSDRFEDREALAAKIEWEGGLMESLDYGIKTEMMPEGDTELTEAWAKLEASFRETSKLADAVADLLDDRPLSPADTDGE